MNVLVPLGLSLVGLSVLWAIQSVVLWRIGEPLAWPMRFTTRHPAPRRVVRVFVPLIWATVALFTPVCLGSSPIDYYARALAAPPGWTLLAVLLVVEVGGFALLHAVGRFQGWIASFREHPPALTRRRLLERLFAIPVPAATVEELVFRVVLLEQLLLALPGTSSGRATAVVLSAAAFSAVHFIPPRPPGPRVAAAVGLFFVGCVCGAGYLYGGRTLWYPLAFHAVGIALVEVPRLYTRFDGGAWLIGTREFPLSGLIGIGMSIVGITLLSVL